MALRHCKKESILEPIFIKTDGPMGYNGQKNKMKRTSFLMVALFFGAVLFSSFTKNDCNSTPSVTELENLSEIVFRGKQVFVNYNLKQEIYCYTNGKVEWFDEGTLSLSCYYTVDGSDIRFTDEDGNTAIKGYISWNNTHSKPISITIKGTTYRNKN